MPNILVIAEDFIEHFCEDDRFSHVRFVQQKAIPHNLEDYLTTVLEKITCEKIIIYLYKHTKDKQEILLKMRNILLPDTLFFPLQNPTNHATQKSILSRSLIDIEQRQHPQFNKIYKKWNKDLHDVTQLTISSTVRRKQTIGEKSDKANKTDQSLPDKYSLRIEKSNKVIKRKRGQWQELIKLADKEMLAHPNLEVLQLNLESHRSSYRTLNGVQHVGNTLKLEACGLVTDKGE